MMQLMTKTAEENLTSRAQSI